MGRVASQTKPVATNFGEALVEVMWRISRDFSDEHYSPASGGDLGSCLDQKQLPAKAAWSLFQGIAAALCTAFSIFLC